MLNVLIFGSMTSGGGPVPQKCLLGTSGGPVPLISFAFFLTVSPMYLYGVSLVHQ